MKTFLHTILFTVVIGASYKYGKYTETRGCKKMAVHILALSYSDQEIKALEENILTICKGVINDADEIARKALEGTEE